MAKLSEKEKSIQEAAIQQSIYVSQNQEYYDELAVIQIESCNVQDNNEIIEEKVIEPVKIILSIEQVARMKIKGLKPHHIKPLLKFCNSSGYSASGTEEEMVRVLRLFGYAL